MNRKARTRRSKIPMSVRNGEAGLILLAGTDPSERRTQPPPAEVSQAESSPPPVGLRPQAPALAFPTTAPRPSGDAEVRAADTTPTLQTADETPPDAVHPDDVSVPPIGLDGDFFGSDLALADASFEIDPRDPRILKLTPLMAQRRARFAKYVTVAVGFAAILCAVAAVKITIARGTETTSRGAANRTSVAAPSPVAAQEPVAAPVEKPAVAEETAPRPDPGAAVVAPNEAPSRGQATAAQAAPEPAQAAVAPAQAEAPSASAAAVPSTAETPTGPTLPADVADLDPKALAKEAGKAKAKARGALEWGKMGDAIEAGERSVAIDPTDSEAWLILGVAYQQKGDSKNAVRSFKACLDQGKRGPRNECALMMR
jgi:hypothetical protein